MTNLSQPTVGDQPTPASAPQIFYKSHVVQITIFAFVMGFGVGGLTVLAILAPYLLGR